QDRVFSVPGDYSVVGFDDLPVNEVDIRPAYINPFTHSRAAAKVASGALELDALVTKTKQETNLGKAPLPGEIKVIVRP
ncbi:hypothetical protein ACC760_38275, partial [Rhizobium ruizarguesonis]